MTVSSLNGYREQPDPLFDRLVLTASEWLREHRVLEGEARLRALDHAAAAAGMFTFYCSPEQSDLQTLEMTSEFAAIFFYLDDIVETAALTDSTWSEFHAELMNACRPGADAATGNSPIAGWLVRFMAATADRRDLQQNLVRSFERYCQSLDTERKREYRSENIDVQSYWMVRRDAVFAEPYIACLQALLGLVVPAQHEGAARGLLARAIDMICIVNDLGSVERDKGGGDLNLVFVYASALGTTVESAMQQARTEHDRLADGFREIAANLQGRLDAYIDLLVSVVDGNLRSTLEYAARFGSPHELLLTIPPLRPSRPS